MAAYHVVFGNAFGLIMERDETQNIKDYQFDQPLAKVVITCQV